MKHHLSRRPRTYLCAFVIFVIAGFSNSEAVDMLYINAGIYDTDGNLIKSPFTSVNADNIVLASNGNMFVTEQYGGDGNGRVLEYDRSGNLLRTVLDGLVRPRGIAFDNQGNFYLGTDYTIRKYDVNGNMLDNGSRFGKTDVVDSIVIDSTSGVLYYARNWNYWGAIGRAELNNNSPVTPEFIPGMHSVYGLALDGKGYLYVANSEADTIIKYDLSGNVINASYISGNANGLNTPYQMAFDSIGNLYVTNINYSRITGSVGIPGFGWVSKYDADGNRLNSPMPTGTPTSRGIAIVPEPSTFILSVLSVTSLIFASSRKRVIIARIGKETA